MKNLLKEISLLLLIGIPYIYLASIWNNLPETVPTHFNINGEADDWHHKSFLLYVPGVILIGIYFLFLFLPKIDPKGKIKQMGEKYFTLRFILFLFLALLNVYVLYATQKGNMHNPNILIGLLGGLFAAFGNYLQTVRPNYFIGIRTPWTLQSDVVWKKTHRIGGRLMMGGGFLIIILSFFISNNVLFAILFGSILAVMVLVPLVYSFKEFQKEKKLNMQEEN